MHWGQVLQKKPVRQSRSLRHLAPFTEVADTTEREEQQMKISTMIPTPINRVELEQSILLLLFLQCHNYSED